MIVIEGPDMAGKTTLANAIWERLKGDSSIMVRHFTKPGSGFDKYWGYRECIQRNVILDRFHMSNVAYRSIDGEPNDLDPITYSMVDAEITRVGGVVVVLAPDESVIRERWSSLKRDEMYDLDFVLRVADVFRTVVKEGWIYTDRKNFWPQVDLAFGHQLHTAAMSTGEMASLVIEAWHEKQRKLDDILFRRQQYL